MSQMGNQIKPGTCDLEYYSLCSEMQHIHNIEKLTAYENIVMGRNGHQDLFYRSLEEGRWSKIPGKASEWEETLRGHVKVTEFG